MSPSSRRWFTHGLVAVVSRPLVRAHRWVCVTVVLAALAASGPFLGAAPQLLPGVYGYGADRATNPAGFGASATILEVTSLADTTATGTLRWAINQSGPRIVVFRTSGVIELASNLNISNGNITIAGQTAPSPGISIHGASLNITASNVLVQHLRIRPGDRWSGVSTTNRDAVSISDSGETISNVVIDHCTFSWTLDEVASTWYAWDNVTFNKCIFAEPLHNSTHLDEGTFSPNVHQQAENLSNTKSGFSTTTNTSNSVAIGGTYQLVNTDSDGDYIEYTLTLVADNAARGGKHVCLVGVKGPDRARFRVEVRDAGGGLLLNPGEIIDQYASSASQHTYVSHQDGTTVFSIPANATTLRVRVIVAGRHASSTGWKLGIDQISITDSHGFGPLFSAGEAAGGKLTMTGSILAHCVARSPWSAAKHFYFGNNIVYNRRQLGLHFGHSSWTYPIHAAVTGNSFIEGASWSGSSSVISNSTTPASSQLYIPTANNVYDSGDRASPPAMISSSLNTFLVGSDPTVKSNGLAGVTALPPATAFQQALLFAGARPADRDAHENRIIDEITDGATITALASRPGSIKHTVTGAGGWPTYAVNTVVHTYPSNPNSDSDGDGYTNIEEWLHQKAAEVEGTAAPIDPPNTFNDNFADGNANGWTTDGGSWSVVSGTYRQTDVNATANRSVLTGTNWIDQVIETDARYTAVSGSDRFFGVVARYTGPGDYYYFILRTGGTVELKKLSGGLVTSLATPVSYAVALNTTYRLRLVAEGTSLRGYINGALVIQGTDAEHTSGQVGLITYLTTVEFDNVMASSTVSTPPPGAFSLLSPSNAATGVALTPTLDWGDASGVATYTLTLDDNSNFSSPVLMQSGIAASQLTPGSALAGATTYFWRVSAVNAGGTTAASNNDFSFTTLLSAPSGLGATAASISQINLSWTDNSSNEDGFRIERKKGAGGTYAEITTVGAGVTGYSDTNLGAGTQYYYRVRAYRGSINSGYSAEANATTTEVTSGRQAHWKFDENTGTSTADASGNANNGTLTNGPTWVAGRIGSAIDFDAVDDVVAAGSGASLDNLAAITITAWIRADSIGEGGNPGRIVHKGTGTSATNGWQFVTQGSNTIAFAVDHATTDLNRVGPANAITFGAWRHVAVTWTGSATATDVKLYVDGVEVSSYATSTNGSGARSSDASSSAFIGNDNTGVRTFDGAIDDVRIYNRVITNAELQAIYRAGL